MQSVVSLRLYGNVRYLFEVSQECQLGMCSVRHAKFLDITVYESSNYYDPLSNSLISDISFDNPNATSSSNRATRPAQDSIHQSATPRNDIPLKVLVVNCQSIRGANRKPLFHNMIESTKPDIVIGCESWLDNSISSTEVFPPDYKAYRKYRRDGSHGGVFTLVSDQLQSDEPEELKVDTRCELQWVRVKVVWASHLYVGSFYRTPDETDPDYLFNLETYLQRIPADLTYGLEETSTCQE